MPPDPTRRAPAAGLLLCVGMVCLSGCAALKPVADTARPAPAQAAPDLPALQAAALAASTLALHRFSGATPDEQLALLAAARQAADQAPSPASRLRYALLLALPGQSGADPVQARQILQSLLEQPDTLSPTEHAQAFLELRRIDRELALAADVTRLRESAELIDSEALAALNRRLLAETDENQRLRRALDDAQAKLAAIALIERQTRDRDADAPDPPEAP